MERLNWHMAEELSRLAEVRVVGPSGSARLSPKHVHVSEVPLKPLWNFLVQVQWRALVEAMRWKPDWILAGSGLTAPAVLLAARWSGAGAAAYVHGLDLAVAHPVYRSLWLSALRRMDRVVANSVPTCKLAEDIGIDRRRLGVVHPGVEMPSLSADAAAGFRAFHGVGNRPLLLSVGRLSERKGMREFVAGSLPRIADRLPDVLLLVVGDAPANALHAKAQTREEIQAVADDCGVGQNLRFMGQVTDAELADIYQASDVHVFPVRGLPGDPEGFGMVAIEAAAHGLPTVAFASGGTIDAVAEGRSGRLVESGDYQAFADAVLEVFRARGSLAAGSIDFARRFAWPEFGSRLARELASRLEAQGQVRGATP
jgi:phosphatidylinositol alpha-1,6-mannosyltransferase